MSQSAGLARGRMAGGILALVLAIPGIYLLAGSRTPATPAASAPPAVLRPPTLAELEIALRRAEEPIRLTGEVRGPTAGMDHVVVHGDHQMVAVLRGDGVPEDLGPGDRVSLAGKVTGKSRFGVPYVEGKVTLVEKAPRKTFPPPASPRADVPEIPLDPQLSPMAASEGTPWVHRGAPPEGVMGRGAASVGEGS